MKYAVCALATLGCFIAIPSEADAQTKRQITGGGGLGNSSIGISPAKPKPQPQKIVKHITYMAASPKRAWTSTDGKTIVAALLAFDPDPKAKKPVAPVIVKDGKIRLLKNEKPFILPLTRLQKNDQAYVAKIAEAAKASVTKPQAAPAKE